METSGEFVVRSVGYGVYLVSAVKEADARVVGEQIGHVLEVAADTEPGSFVVVTDGWHPTSKMEAAIVADEEVASAVRRAAAGSPGGSALRSRLKLVDAACVSVMREPMGRLCRRRDRSVEDALRAANGVLERNRRPAGADDVRDLVRLAAFLLAAVAMFLLR